MRKFFCVFVSILVVLSGIFAPAQEKKNTLAELFAELPAMVHGKTMEFGAYSDAVVAAYKKHPDEFEGALPQLRRDLEDKDPEAQRLSVAMVYGLAVEGNDLSLIVKVSDELEPLLLHGDDWTRKMTMVAVEALHEGAPEQLVAPLFVILKDEQAPDGTRGGAAEALMRVRPRDSAAEEAVIRTIEDKHGSERLRCISLYGARSEFVGDLMVGEVILVANTSEDKDLRDTAISAAEGIGIRALVPLQPKLEKIAKDAAETEAAREMAWHALGVLAGLRG